MSIDAIPEFLFVQTPRDHRVNGVEAVALASQADGGQVIAAASARDVEILEPGTPAADLLIARWGSRQDFDQAWNASVSAAVADLAGSNVLAVPGLPVTGLPDELDIPTVASVGAPKLSSPPSYMVVQGVATDGDRIGRYRDIILPMLKERSAYYIVLSIAEEGVRVLRGSWSQQIFAISRWPTHDSAHDFWFCDRYQDLAIPTRAGAGTFHVHLLRGRMG